MSVFSCLFIRMYISKPIYRHIGISVYRSIYLSLIYICRPVCLSIDLIDLSIYPSVYLSIHPSIPLSIYLSTCKLFVHACVCVYLYLYLYL